MSPATPTGAPPFGRILTAMVTPMTADGALDLAGAAALAEFLVSRQHDGLVVFGTTGEAPTLTDDEKVQLLTTVRDAVGDRARIVAGAGSNDTAHSVELAKRCADAGAHGILAVTPYYNLPTPAGIEAHFTAIADATDLPVLLYDIPHRSGRPITVESLITLADHPRIVGVKDAKCDLWAMTKVLDATGLHWYCGADEFNLPMLALGATGIVSVVGHVASTEYAGMLAAVDRGDLATARSIHRRLIPVTEAIMNTSQGAIMAKAAMAELGVIDSAAVRLPLVESPTEHLDKLRAGLAASGLQ